MVEHPVNDPNRPVAFFLLSALLGLFWRQKVLILIVIVLGALMGSLYLWNTSPLYEAKAYFVSPTDGDIVDFNAGRSSLERNDLRAFTSSSICRVFARELASQSLKHAFFNASTSSLGGMTYAQFDKRFLVRDEPDFSPGKPPEKYSVTVRAPTASLAVDWVTRYVALAEKNAMKTISGIMSAQKKNVAHVLLRKISLIQAVSEQERQDRLTQLNEALQIARSIGLNAPTGDSSSLYMRGSRALIAEINALTARESNDAFSPGLRALQREYASLQKNHENLGDVKIFHLDGAIAGSSEPVSPKKQLVFILALVLGLSLGCLMALIRDLFLMNTPHEARNAAPGLMRRILG